MKTYVIKLEKHDDIISARDKIAWSKSTRVLLILPEKGYALFKKLDIVLLQRFANSLGAQIAVVSTDEDVIAHALDLGIPVFKSELIAQRSPWRRNLSLLRGMKLRKDTVVFSGLLRGVVEAERLRLQRSRYRIPVFVLGLLSVILLLLFFLPSADVSIQMAEQEQSLQITVWANSNIPVPNVSGGLPAKEISVIVESQDQIVSTGKMSLPSEPAFGEVTLKNLTDQEVYVPPGTVLLALRDKPIRFRTVSAVTIPAGLDQFQDVSVEAVVPGVSGNLPEGSIRAVEGEIGLKLTVDNRSSTQGGVDLESPSPTEMDYQNLKKKILTKLTQAAAEEIRVKLDSEQELIPGSIQLRKILEEKRDPGEQMPGDRLNLNIRAEYSALFYEKVDVEKVAQYAMDASLDPDFVPVPNTMLVTPLNIPQVDEQNARWEIYSIRRIKAKWSKEALSLMILGSKSEHASETINESFHLANQPIIQIYPSFWHRLPYLPFRIRVSAQ